MSFRSTFVSPGGFTTQRLDLILEKRKVPDPDSGEEDGDRLSHDAPRLSSRDHEVARSKARSESARLRHNNGARRRLTLGQTNDKTTDPFTKLTCSETVNNLSPSSSPARVLQTQSFVLPRRRSKDATATKSPDSAAATYNSRKPFWAGGASLDEDPMYHARSSTAGPDRVHSLLKLPSNHNGRPAESVGSVRGDGQTGSMPSVARPGLDLPTEEPGGQVRGRPGGRRGVRRAQSALILPSEKSLASRRFQQLFSSGLDDNDSGENSPDSLDGGHKGASSEEEEVVCRKGNHGYNYKKKSASDKNKETNNNYSDHADPIIRQSTSGRRRTYSEIYRSPVRKIEPSKSERKQDKSNKTIRGTTSREPDVRDTNSQNNYKTLHARSPPASAKIDDGRTSIGSTRGVSRHESSPVGAVRSNWFNSGVSTRGANVGMGEGNGPQGKVSLSRDKPLGLAGLTGYRESKSRTTDGGYSLGNEIGSNQLGSRAIREERDNSRRPEASPKLSQIFPGYLGTPDLSGGGVFKDHQGGRGDDVEINAAKQSGWDYRAHKQETSSSRQQSGETLSMAGHNGTTTDTRVVSSCTKYPRVETNGLIEDQGRKEEAAVGDASLETDEGARSPRVSFSDDLKVVPPSPAAGRKQWGSSVGGKGGVEARGGGETSGRSPVKGILQNGRREGDVLVLPAPDDSEMREEEEEPYPAVFAEQRSAPSSPPSWSPGGGGGGQGQLKEEDSKAKKMGTIDPANSNGHNTSPKGEVVVQQDNPDDSDVSRYRYAKGFGSGLFAMRQKKLAYGLQSLSDGNISHPHLKVGNAIQAPHSIKEAETEANASNKVASSGFTLSFKDFMTERKKQGKCVLPKTNKLGENMKEHETTSYVRSENGADTATASKGFNAEQAKNMDIPSSHGNIPVNLSQSTAISKVRVKGGKGHERSPVGQTHGCVVEDGSESDPMNPKEGSPSLLGSRLRTHGRKKMKDSASLTTKKDNRVGVALSALFRRSKKGKNDHIPNESESDSTLDGNASEADDGKPDVVANVTPAESKEPSMGRCGAFSLESSQSERLAQSGAGGGVEDAEPRGTGFSLGPHGHGGSDPLMAFFVAASRGGEGASPPGGGDQNEEQEEEQDSDTESSSTLSAPSVVLRSNDTRRKLKTSASFSNFGDRYRGVMTSPGARPNYTQFLDVDSLMSNLNSRADDRSPSSSSVSGAGDSLEDLALAVLEAELVETGQHSDLADWTQEEYQEKLRSIKEDLERFSERLGQSLKKHKHADSVERAPSVSGLSATSTRSSRSPWLRDPSADAKPITDPALRNKLKTARSSNAKVTSRDQKILELMMQKREEERKQDAKREAARRAWESEKQRETANKTTAEIKRRESLGRIRLSPSKKLEDGHGDHDDGSPCDRQWTTQSQRLLELRPDQEPAASRTGKMSKYRSMNDMHKQCERPWVANSQTLLSMKEKKMQERRMQNLQRKKSQEDKKRAAEERVQMRKREEEDLARHVQERQERDLKRANSMKEAREQEQIVQRKLKNYYTKKKHEERVTDMKRQSKEETNSLQAAIEMKHATAQSHLQQLNNRRDGELRRSTSVSQTDLETRLSRSKENQSRLQEELVAWHSDLLNYRKMMEKRAEEQAKLNAQSRGRKASEERKHREKMQRKNLKKLLNQEEEWKADVEATIAMKDARTRMLQMEKDETVQESRAMAAASQRMREELRSAYSSDHIDQLSKRAELEARIGLAGSSPHPASAASKNVSHIKLG